MEKAFIVRPNPNGEDRLKEFLSENIIAIGWEHVGNMANCSKGEIKDKLQQETNYVGGDMNIKVGQINNFVNEMELGDYIITPNGDDIYIGEVASDYFYNDNCKGYSHQRSVEWRNKENPVKRSDIHPELRRSLRTMISVGNITQHFNLIDNLFKPVAVKTTANLIIEMDEELKNQAETLIAGMGLNMNIAVTLFAKAIVQQRRIPFEIIASPDQKS